MMTNPRNFGGASQAGLDLGLGGDLQNKLTAEETERKKKRDMLANPSYYGANPFAASIGELFGTQ